MKYFSILTAFNGPRFARSIPGWLPRLLAIFFLNVGCFPSGFILGVHVPSLSETSSSSQRRGEGVCFKRLRLKNLLVFSEDSTLRQGHSLGGTGKVGWREERPHGAGLQQACCDIHIAHKGATPESIRRLRGNAR